MKGLFSKSKSRRTVAAATAVLLAVLSFLAVQGEGLQIGNLVLALFLSVLAGVLILADFHMGKVLSVIWYLVLPLQALCCMEFYTHVPWDLTAPILLLNYLFYLIWYLICAYLTGSTRWGGTVAPLLPLLFGLANYFVVQFRSSPIVPWDFYSIGTAVTVSDHWLCVYYDPGRQNGTENQTASCPGRGIGGEHCADGSLCNGSQNR